MFLVWNHVNYYADSYNNTSHSFLNVGKAQLILFISFYCFKSITDKVFNFFAWDSVLTMILNLFYYIF